MALTKTIKVSGDGRITSNGVSYPVTNVNATYSDCYIKVATVGTSKTEGQAVVVFSAEANGSILFERNFLFQFDLEGPNPIKQAYLHLKTLLEFADAVDC
jgi:hypothetical protein